MFGIRKTIRRTAQRVALGGVGAFMLLIGLGFLTASAALYLWTVTDPITACAVLGGVYFGVGLLILFAAQESHEEPVRERPKKRLSAAEQAEMTPVAAVFLKG